MNPDDCCIPGDETTIYALNATTGATKWTATNQCLNANRRTGDLGGSQRSHRSDERRLLIPERDRTRPWAESHDRCSQVLPWMELAGRP